ncbi:MAG: cation transporter [Planctomycetes bacterium]|nr:cation transporter [Planctomycetota bacterium]
MGGDHHHTYDIGVIGSTREGMRVAVGSLVFLSLTTVLQGIVVYFTGSVALLADTLHNLGDAATAIPLGIAFWLARRRPSARFPYGYGRAEDLAGLLVLALMLASAFGAARASLGRLRDPQPIAHAGWVAAAALVGFLGNEAVAIWRIRVGRRIQSAALVADGLHARVDGLTSLSVLLGTGGTALGFPRADPVVGLAIAAVILGVTVHAARSVLLRVLDGVDPGLLDRIRHAAAHPPGVADVSDVRARWGGHWLHAEVNVAVDPRLTVEEGHRIANAVRAEVAAHLEHVSNVVVHVDPVGASGESHHQR